MNKPYRVVVWGPGGIGTVAIREIAMLNWLELVGVRAYSESKHGLDAGELIGIEPLGVTVSANPEEVKAIDCDVVIYAARDYGIYHTDDEIIDLLEAGKNLVTVLPYQHLNIVKPPEFIERLQAACETGQSVFHATGVDPDVIGDRIIPAITTMCSDIRHVQLQENWNVDSLAVETLQVCGYGQPKEQVEANEAAQRIGDNFGRQACYGFAELMGLEYDRVDVERIYPVADNSTEYADGLLVQKGTVNCYTLRWSGYVNSIGAKPFFQIEFNWHLGGESVPANVKEDVQGWVITVEGRPSIRTVMDIKADLDTRERYIVPGDKSSESGYHAVVAPVLQAIPHIVKARPGVLETFTYNHHWSPEFQ